MGEPLKPTDPALLRALRTELIAARTTDPEIRRQLLEIARRWRAEAGERNRSN